MASFSALKIDTGSFLHSLFREDGQTVTQETEILWQRLEPLREQLSSKTDATLPAFVQIANMADQCGTSRLWKQRIQDSAQTLVVLGIGGSSLGAEMLTSSVGGGTKRVLFFDNVDPTTLNHMGSIQWEDAFLLIVSKSGGTAETLSQFLSLLPTLEKRHPSLLRERTAVITENRAGALHAIAQDLSLPVITHPSVGGRFSVLSVVGLIPAAFTNVDIETLIEGAQSVVAATAHSSLNDPSPLQMALAQYTMARSGMPLSVQFVYADKLRSIPSWFAQLWAESLGKKQSERERFGLTPVTARGVTDQHSQLQLYLDGPRDKQFTMINDPTLVQQGDLIDDRFAHLEAVAPLAGKRTGQLFDAEFRGTRDSLINNDMPVRTFSLPGCNALALGQLIMYLELETFFVAALAGIDAFDQPAVEESKVRAKHYLAHSSN
ncbi:MAG: glucose-6-phosphate isomerase [Magnetococcales bacterium]|nr:glucose-6-phosphate isomerase [Magnetococcales bacterium]